MRSPSFTETSDALDSADSLSAFRARFHLPPGQIYLDGNSLGLLSTDAELALKRVIEEWKTLGIGGWLDGQPPWFMMAEEAGRLMAPLMGADSDEVIFGSSTTVKIHQLLATLYAPRGNRTKILIDALAFPTDRYAITSHLRLRGL